MLRLLARLVWPFLPYCTPSERRLSAALKEPLPGILERGRADQA
jgi:hypothetical protein